MDDERYPPYNKVMADKFRDKKIDLSALSRQDLERKYILLMTEYESSQAQIEWYKEQYRLSLQKRYGTSSEKNIVGQMSLSDLPLFNEAEVLRDPINIEPAISEEPETDATSNASKKKSRKKNTKHLPHVTINYTLSEEEKICPKCNGALHEMKKEVLRQIEVIPASVRVVEHVSDVYACRTCEELGDASIVKAPGAPVPIIPKSVAGSSLIADFITKKYQDAIPFYRIEKNNERAGIPVTRNNMCNWSIKVADMYFAPIVDRMRQVMFSDGVIHCDETFVEVLAEPDRPAQRKSYIWVTTTAESQKEHPIALYNYREGRSAYDARAVLDGFEGYIMCDGYAAYDALLKPRKDGSPPMNVTLVACMIHIRRKFVEALQVVPVNARGDTGCEMAIEMIATITHADSKLKDVPPKERYEKRLFIIKPMMEEFFDWAESELALALPRSKYGQALEYACNLRKKAMHAFLDGRLEFNNNHAERAVKPFVIGRKNWLFADSPSGADASCILYSIVETAKRNHLIPFEYIKYVLDEIPKERQATQQEIEHLLPWSPTLPDYVKNPGSV